MLSLQLSAPVDHAKGSCANLLENVIVIVHAVLCLDLDGLRDVLGVDVKHKLVVVPDLTLLTTDFLASFRINFIKTRRSWTGAGEDRMMG
jgi:hypothetical protein